MMATTQQKETVSTGRRTSGRFADYDIVGVDSEGATHIFRAFDETVHVVDADGEREYRFELEEIGITVDQYSEHVANKRGWGERYYFDNGADAIKAALGGSR
jgi:hypothetical protein